jgi:multidrug resistance efflux pump
MEGPDRGGIVRLRFDTSKQKDPTKEKGVQVSYAPAKRKVAQWRWYLILFVVSSPLLYFFGKLLVSFLIVTAPGYLSLEKVSVNSAATGYVERVNVRVGDTVAEGDVLVELGSPALDEREYMLRSELRNLTVPFPSSTPETEALLRERIRLAGREVAYQEEKREKVQFLFDQGAATIAELNLAEADVTRAEFTLNQARSELTAQWSRTRRDASTEEQRTVRCEMIKAELEVVRQQRGRLAQRALFPGRVLDIFIGEGEVLSPGTPMLLMGRVDQPYVLAYLDTRYGKYGMAGRKAWVKFAGGDRIEAIVREDSSLSKRLPADLSSPIGSRDIMIVVKLDFLEPVPEPACIDALPVSLRFHFAW